VLNGILWVLCANAPWKDLPDRHPPRHTCRSEAFIDGSFVLGDTADGVPLMITLSNPPGFLLLRQAFKGKSVSPYSLKMEGRCPDGEHQNRPGYVHE
jgi:hypothetical protein